MQLKNERSGVASAPIQPLPFRIYNEHNFDQIRQLRRLCEEQRFAIQVVAQVLPFRVNQYVIDYLIAWDDVPDDPMFRLVFPQSEMRQQSLQPHSSLPPVCDDDVLLSNIDLPPS